MPASRIQSIDFLRGLVMVLMAIDHSRTFLHSSFNEFNAEDLTKTTPVLFFTRWVTHFCAPVFIFLTGTAAYLMLRNIQSKKQLAGFLISRALILIFLELTVFRFCWSQGRGILEPFFLLVVIWAIAISMIFLAVAIWLPYRIILVLGFLILILHNTLAGIQFPEGSGMYKFWAFFYSGGYVNLFGNVSAFFLYPVLPYFGLISLGYCLGALYKPDYPAQRRKKLLISMGITAIVLFIVLRSINGYGDPRSWEPQKNTIYSIMAFLRATKYPVSLMFALMILGPSLLILAFIEPVRNRITNFFVTIGSVPMFYYILHLLFFVTIGFITGFNKNNLLIVYVWFVIVVAILYVLSRWYAKYKFSHPQKKWLRYL